ncbi:Uncharacterised protein [Mycobacterium tuberculosis]|nr:Uncharacterised protein [Mycobacterium tuberculosis]
MTDSWQALEIPHAWTTTSMLRSMIVDHLGPDKSFEDALNDDTRQRMIGLAVMGHVELADKTARLIQQFAVLIEELGELGDRSNALREAIVQLAELIDNREG